MSRHETGTAAPVARPVAEERAPLDEATPGTPGGASDGGPGAALDGKPGTAVDSGPGAALSDGPGTGPGAAVHGTPGDGLGGASGTGAAPRPSSVRHMARLLASEAGLTFRRPRNLAMLGVLAVVPVLIGVAVRLASDDTGGSIVGQIAGNGLMLTFAAFAIMLPIVLPLTVAVVAGDAVAGEAAQGTLRYLLVAPVGRARLLALKYANVVVFCLAACALVALSALAAGLVLFPAGPVTLLSGTTVSASAALLRIGVVVLYAAAGMAALGAVALAVSTLTEAPIGAVAASVVTVVVSQVLSAVPQLAAVRPFLLTTWWGTFDGALRAPIDVDRMGQGLLAFAAYVLVFGSVAWARFTSKDVTA
ncbi:ABC transporter permease [Microbispora triticiradicis]|uniref:ABC transporter permease n=1 Tax=Microbispora triticiradicis TaxID=2200763 RepID=A0ABX9LHI7_9ACTN|nr:ABC transporter permease subunit [Microbispora triticiradicis]RGA03426.1 ABC transporter permease [Microbispora triticiradicis]